MAATEHVLAIADATQELIVQRAKRVREVGLAHTVDGLSYPALSREVSMELLRRGMSEDVLDGAGVGPDNLRKLVQ